MLSWLNERECGRDLLAQIGLSLASMWVRVRHGIWSAAGDYPRGNQLGDNAIWLMGPMSSGQKAVIWAHTIHVAKGLQRRE
jgi:hypothetical protein